MGFPKEACSGIFIGENAHKSQSLRYTYRENALAFQTPLVDEVEAAVEEGVVCG